MAVDPIFQTLIDTIQTQQTLINSIAEELQKLKDIGGGGGGTGNAVIEDYESGKEYTRNTLVVDTITETVYRVISDEPYLSETVEQDCANGKLKLVGFESQIVTFDHSPTQEEINQIPDDALVAVYSSTDVPYVPSSQ